MDVMTACVLVIESVTVLLGVIAWALYSWRSQQSLLVAHRELLGMLGNLKIADANIRLQGPGAAGYAGVSMGAHNAGFDPNTDPDNQAEHIE